MTADLVAFLRARLDEDEATARAVEDGSAPWTGQWENDNGRALRTRNGHVLAYLPDARPFKPGVLDHIARHDPARVLAEVDAKRRELALHGAEPGQHPDFCGYDKHELPCPSLRLRALPYANHPDYRDEWRP